jgi:hypothetical protein
MYYPPDGTVCFVYFCVFMWMTHGDVVSRIFSQVVDFIASAGIAGFFLWVIVGLCIAIGSNLDFF